MIAYAVKEGQEMLWSKTVTNPEGSTFPTTTFGGAVKYHWWGYGNWVDKIMKDGYKIIIMDRPSNSVWCCPSMLRYINGEIVEEVRR